LIKTSYLVYFTFSGRAILPWTPTFQVPNQKKFFKTFFPLKNLKNQNGTQGYILPAKPAVVDEVDGRHEVEEHVRHGIHLRGSQRGSLQGNFSLNYNSFYLK
jgi:hypothetical protein